MSDPFLPPRDGPDFSPEPAKRRDVGLIVLGALAALGVVAFVLGFRR